MHIAALSSAMANEVFDSLRSEPDNATLTDATTATASEPASTAAAVPAVTQPFATAAAVNSGRSLLAAPSHQGTTTALLYQEFSNLMTVAHDGNGRSASLSLGKLNSYYNDSAATSSVSSSQASQVTSSVNTQA